jgi:hypothetical protein
VSATNRGAERRPYDDYSTPAWCTEAIMREIVWGHNPLILEPCAGDGSIVHVLEPWLFRKTSPSIVAIDIRYGQDFLAMDLDRRFDFVITNPPYSLAQEFVTKALEVANCTIMLLRLGFLAGQHRREWWRKHPPTALFVLSKRPSFTGRGTDATDYAWFVWDSTGRQKRGLYWL